MGIFKLFSKANNNAAIAKTSQPMDEDQFWQLVNDSLNKSGAQDDQQEYLTKKLRALPTEDIIGFKLRTDKLLHDTYTPEMWCAGYIMNGGCSDDGFEYFRLWIISRGQDVYYNAKANPDSLIAVVDPESDLYDFESFWSVANDAFQEKTGKDLYDYVDDDNVDFGEGKYPEMVLNWEEEDPESMKVLCPQLFEKMWDN